MALGCNRRIPPLGSRPWFKWLIPQAGDCGSSVISQQLTDNGVSPRARGFGRRTACLRASYQQVVHITHYSALVWPCKNFHVRSLPCDKYYRQGLSRSPARRTQPLGAEPKPATAHTSSVSECIVMPLSPVHKEDTGLTRPWE